MPSQASHGSWMDFDLSFHQLQQLSCAFRSGIWSSSFLQSTTPGLFGGGMLGYVIYDCTYYYLHHGQPSSDPGKHLKKYHLNHHFVDSGTFSTIDEEMVG